LGNRYVVLDTETTGLSSSGHDRILEIGLVLLDENFNLEGTWETLVNPNRDVGLTSKHGITATDVVEAPNFAEISTELAQLLADRVVLAHNANFDMGFMNSEYLKLVSQEPNPEAWFCTLNLSKWAFPKLKKYSLEALCQQFEIQNRISHSAGSDAMATFELLQRIFEVLPAAKDLLRESATADYAVPNGLPRSNLLPRAVGRAKMERSFIQRLVPHLSSLGASVAESEYGEFLKMALFDDVLSEGEIKQLIEFAESSGLSEEDVERIHLDYFNNLRDVAWADGVLSGDEQAQLREIARLLGLGEITLEAAFKEPEVTTEISPPSGDVMFEGAIFLLTGSMVPGKTQTSNLLSKNGFTVVESFSKRVNFVVAADVNTSSGKAGQARKNGIPVIDSQWIWKNFS